MLWIAWPLTLLGAETNTTPEIIPGNQWQAMSQNFVVQNSHAGHDAREVARHCEAWRTRLQTYWTAIDGPAWKLKCTIKVHANASSYLAAVGAGARQTYGSSLIKFDAQKQVAVRTIDIRGDSPLGLAAMPHELTHVILADLLGGRQPPRWADEGMAILADTHEKQTLHERDLSDGIARRAAFRVAELMTIESYPAAGRMGAFYGQSASLTACLARRDEPAKFVEFLRGALDHGYDRALRDVYDLAGVGELEQVWREERVALSRPNARGSIHGVRLAIDETAVASAASME